MKPTFSPSDAALSIFEFTKRQPQFVMRYCLLYTAFNLLVLLFVSMTGLGATFADYIAYLSSGKVPEVDAIQKIFAGSIGPILIVMLLGYAGGVALLGIALRKTVRNSEDGPMGLQFGKDEANLVVAGLLLFLAYIGIALIGGIVAGLSAALTPILGVVAGAALVLGIFYAAFRISQFGVVVVASGKVSLRQIWERTEGQFWRFVGAYLLWFIIAMVISLILNLVGGAIASALGTNVNKAIPTSLAEFLTVGWLFYFAFSGVINGFMKLSAVCVGAYAWHQMGGDATSVEEVF